MSKRNHEGNQDGPPEKNLVQSPKVLYDGLAHRIQNEEDAVKRAEYVLQQAKAFYEMKKDEIANYKS